MAPFIGSLSLRSFGAKKEFRLLDNGDDTGSVLSIECVLPGMALLCCRTPGQNLVPFICVVADLGHYQLPHHNAPISIQSVLLQDPQAQGGGHVMGMYAQVTNTYQIAPVSPNHTLQPINNKPNQPHLNGLLLNPQLQWSMRKSV